MRDAACPTSVNSAVAAGFRKMELDWILNHGLLRATSKQHDAGVWKSPAVVNPMARPWRLDEKRSEIYLQMSPKKIVCHAACSLDCLLPRGFCIETRIRRKGEWWGICSGKDGRGGARRDRPPGFPVLSPPRTRKYVDTAEY